MSSVYGRKYSLIFGKPAHRQEVDSFDVQVQNKVEGFAAPILTARQYEDIPDTFHEITDLHIVAVLPQSLTQDVSGRDKGYIEIYNASNDTIKKLQNATHIYLKAGYEQDVEMQYVFVGDIQRMATERRFNDIVTTLVCGQRLRAGKDVRVQKTYSPPMSFAMILEDLLNIARQNGIAVGRVRLPPTTRTFDTQAAGDTSEIYHLNSPLPVEGYVLDEIGRVATMAGCRSYMVLGKLYVEPQAVTKTLEVYGIKQENVQGGITRSQSINDKDYSETNEEISLKLFLDPRITVGSYINIEFGEYNDVRGDFKVMKVEHLLEFQGTNWTTEISAKRVDNAGHEHNTQGLDNSGNT